MNIPDAIEAARLAVEDANGEPCIEATEAIDRLARLGPLSVGLAEALEAIKADKCYCDAHQQGFSADEDLLAPCPHEIADKALAAWADAQDGPQPAQEPAGQP